MDLSHNGERSTPTTGISIVGMEIRQKPLGRARPSPPAGQHFYLHYLCSLVGAFHIQPNHRHPPLYSIRTSCTGSADQLPPSQRLLRFVVPSATFPTNGHKNAANVTNEGHRGANPGNEGGMKAMDSRLRAWGVKEGEKTCLKTI